MRKTPNLKTEKFRVRNGSLASDPELGNNGAFLINSLAVIVSDQDGWDHVSVSHQQRVPSWEEMCFIKDLFFRDDEVVIQYHPAKSSYINNHPRCLHMWRPQNADVPTPPGYMVGIKELGELDSVKVSEAYRQAANERHQHLTQKETSL